MGLAYPCCGTSTMPVIKFSREGQRLTTPLNSNSGFVVLGMRTISFVERLELEFHGKIYGQQQAHPWNLCQQAIALGDVDNDGSNELAVGTVSGHLVVYKGSEQKAWRSCKDLGMITCVAVGDVCNKNLNYILVLSADGWCNVFFISPQQQEGESSFPNQELQPIHRQHLSANSKVLMMADIDGDGKIEIAVGYSDRLVRTYRWYPHSDTKGEIAFLNKWALDAQIGSISLKPEENNSCDLVVSQPSGAYVILKSDGQVLYNKPPTNKTRNDSVCTEVVGNVRTEDDRNYYALTTLDGTIMLMDYEGTNIFDIHVDHQLFGLTKLDITGDGVEEVIVCSWDGQTYIVNCNQQIAKFQFDEPTAAFVAGHYSVGSSKNEACLIYVTFSGRIYIYHNIKLAHVQIVSLVEALEGSDNVEQFMEKMGKVDCTREEKKKLYQWCLYGRKPKLCQE